MTGDRWAQLPDFPWDALVPFAEIARKYSDEMIDLSVGTPVDSTPLLVQQALAQASDAPGYPTTAGIAQLSATFIDWARTTLGAPRHHRSSTFHRFKGARCRSTEFAWLGNT